MKKLLIIIFLFCTVTLRAEITSWTQLTEHAGYLPRQGNAMIEFNGYMVVMGGIDSTGYTNTIYTSYNGIDWEAVTPFGTIWTGRYEFGSVVYDGKLWVIGGFNGSAQADIWYTTDCQVWTEISSSVGFLHSMLEAVVYNNKIYVLDSYDITGVNNMWIYDGSSWGAANPITDFDPVYDPEMVVFNNKIWLIGGRRTNATDDIYSSVDGINWTLESNDPAFSARSEHAVILHNEKLYLTGGDPGGGNPFLNDVWVSSNGVDWTQLADVGDVGRFNPNLISYNGYLLYGNGQAVGVPTVGRRNDLYYGIESEDYTPTVTPTFTVTKTNTATFTVTVTKTATLTKTITPTATATPSITPQETKTFTPTVTPTFTASPTSTDTPTISPTWTVSETHTETPTLTVTPTPTTIETVIIWHALNAGYGAPNDTSVSWRQYPDTTDNKVEYTLYIQNVTEATEPDRVLSVPNTDDLDPSIHTFGYVIQGLTGGDCYSVTLTAQGGDLDVLFMSNNIQICPEIRTQIDVVSVKTPVPIAGSTGGQILPYEGAIVSMDWIHRKEHACYVVDWDYMTTLAANAVDYIGVVNPPDTKWHWRVSLITANGIAWITPYLGDIGAAGTTLNAIYFGECAALDPVPAVYYNANTTTAEAQKGVTLATGGTDAGTPASAKPGGSLDSLIDWVETYGDNTFFFKLTAGDSSTKVWLSLEAYED